MIFYKLVNQLGKVERSDTNELVEALACETFV